MDSIELRSRDSLWCFHFRHNLTSHQASCILVRRCILRLYAAAAADQSFISNTEFQLCAVHATCGGLFDAFRAVLADQRVDEASKALIISLPSASELISLIPSCDPHILHIVFETLFASLARQLRPELEAVVTQCGGTSRYSK